MTEDACAWRCARCEHHELWHHVEGPCTRGPCTCPAFAAPAEVA